MIEFATSVSSARDFSLDLGISSTRNHKQEIISNRFLERVKRITIDNFAKENVKKNTKLPASEMAKTNAESIRDVCIRTIVCAAQKSVLDLQRLLSYPTIKYPLSLAHCDGSMVKTEKATLLNKLETMQTSCIHHMPRRHSLVHDGGQLLHSILSLTNSGASYASIARRLLSAACSENASEIHVCLDKYISNSIKGCERQLRGAVDENYNITGPEQAIRQSGKKLLDNGNFKNELARFLLREWGKDNYWSFLSGKTLFASYGGECIQYVPDELQHINVSKPPHLQGDHEEADTLIAFHVANITESDIVIRASDTDVLVILIGALGQKSPEARAMTNIIMDCGTGNSRRLINVTNIVENLEQRQPGFSRAMPGYHAVTGCDFTSAFYRYVKFLIRVE